MLLQLTYLSDGLRVKGYLWLPPQARATPDDIRCRLRRFFGAEDLSVTELACDYPRPVLEPLGVGAHAAAEAKLPVLMYCRGGSGSFGKVRTHWMETFARFGGAVVFAPCYRGNEGGEGRDEFGGAEQEDVAAAYRFLQQLPYADPERISVMGFSRGSINAAAAAASDLRPYRLILWSGVSDLAQTYEERADLRRMLKRMVGGSPGRVPEAYSRRSPVYAAGKIRCPVLIIHGTEDKQVPYRHAEGMCRALEQAGADVRLHRYEGAGHLLPPEHFDRAVERMFRFISGVP